MHRSGSIDVALTFFPGVKNVPGDVSAHARYMYNHQCAAKRQSIYGINTTGGSLGCI